MGVGYIYPQFEVLRDSEKCTPAASAKSSAPTAYTPSTASGAA